LERKRIKQIKLTLLNTNKWNVSYYQ
jgi:hypothetical protein